MGAHVVIEAAQHVGAAIDQCCFCAHPVENTGEFHRDITGPDDQYALGQLRQVEGLLGRDGVFDAGQVGGHDGAAADGDQDLFSGDGLRLVAEDLDRVRILEHGPAVEQVGAGLLQVGDIDARQPGNLDVLALDEARPVERGLRRRPAVALGQGEVLGEFGRIDHELLGHAAADHAGAADAVFLGHGDARAGHGGQARGAHAARSGADDKQVVVVAHRLVLKASLHSLGRLRRRPRQGRRDRGTGRARPRR